MELKDRGIVLVVSAALLLSAGIFTGGIVFYVCAAALTVAIAGDYVRYRALLDNLCRNLRIGRRLSGKELVPGASFSINYTLSYAGKRPVALRCEQPLDGSMSLLTREQDARLSKGTQAIQFMAVPYRLGKYAIHGLLIRLESVLFQGAITACGVDQISVYLPVRRVQSRVSNRGSLHYSMLAEGEVTRQGSGSDFSGIRSYVPGDSIKYVDWARSSTSSSLVVREFEDVRTLSLFILIDAGTIGQADDAGLDPMIRLAATFSNQVLLDNERTGLACFSDSEVISYLPPGSGKDHRARLMRAFVSLKGEVGGSTVRHYAMPAINEAVSAREAFAGQAGLEELHAIMGEAIDDFAANFREDGFIKAIVRASLAGAQLHMVVFTSLATGVASLLYGIRIARYYGHNVTIVVIRPEPGDESDQEQGLERSLRVKEIIAMLRSMKVGVVETGALERPQEAALGRRIHSTGIRR